MESNDKGAEVAVVVLDVGFGGAIVGLIFSGIYGVAFLLMGGMPRPDTSIIHLCLQQQRT